MSQENTELEYVGFWARVGASIIDTILMCVILFPLLTAIYGMAYWDNEAFIAGPADFLLSYIMPAVVVIVLWARLGATPGKMAIGAVIVDARTGEKPSTMQFCIRYVGYIVSTLVLFLGYVWVGIDSRKQGLHDKMAGTVVVRRKGGTTRPVHFDQKPQAPHQ